MADEKTTHRKKVNFEGPGILSLPLIKGKMAERSAAARHGCGTAEEESTAPCE
jgi:hypothetical protein